MTLAEGDVVGGYRLQKRIAIGGMAEVWAAQKSGDPSARPYAVKVLLDLFARDPKLRTMFCDEAAIAQRLEHPNIIRVEALIEERGALAQVMELVEGRDLRRVLQGVIKTGSTVPIAQAVIIAREVARGLAYAHAAVGTDGLPLHLVHRDVSPHNVMIDRRGRVAILDFGVARARERGTVTSVGTVKGKLAYMAPEQMLAGEVTHLADVWALGVVLWETLALRRAFAVDDMEVVHAVTRTDLPRIDAHRPDAPPRLVELVARMVARDVTARPPSMGAVDAALTDVARGLGESASVGALAAWVRPLLEPGERRTGVIAVPVPSAGAQRKTDTLVSSFDDSLRDVNVLADDLADTAPPGDERAATEAVMVPGGAEIDRTDPVPVPAAPRRGYDVAAVGGRLGPEDQFARTLAPISRPSPGDDEAPTVLPSGPALAPRRTPVLADAATPVTPLASPVVGGIDLGGRGAAPTTPARPPGHRAPEPAVTEALAATRPLVPPTRLIVPPSTTPAPTVAIAGDAPTRPPVAPPSRRGTVAWVAGGLALGAVVMVVLARGCA